MRERRNSTPAVGRKALHPSGPARILKDGIRSIPMNQAPPLSERRVFAVDLLATVLILTVLFLHHRSYTYVPYRLRPIWRHDVHLLLQKFAVGGFLFLSGWKLARSKRSVSPRSFAANRFLRIQPLYLLALVAASFSSYPWLHGGTRPSVPNFLIHAFALQSLLPDLFQPNYYTLWFVSILWGCYLFFLFSRRSLEDPRAFSLRLGIVIVSIPLMRFLAHAFGIRLFQEFSELYVFFFAAGMIRGRYARNLTSRQRILLPAAAAGAAAALLHLYGRPGPLPPWLRTARTALIPAATIPVFVAALDLPDSAAEKPPLLARLLRGISYASMAVFLFHRSIWTVMAALWRGSPSRAQWFYIVGLGVPWILLIGYGIQAGYDRLTRFSRHRRFESSGRS